MTRPPSVDTLARQPELAGLPHPVAVEVAREAIATDRVDSIKAMSRARSRQMLTPVLNATGVLLHTNLGRSPVEVHEPGGYSNLELNLANGQRGSRQNTVGSLLATATGAEAAMVVNNCASAVMLALAAVAPGKRVAVSRGELVEIGGAFRVPDVMAQSGSELVEVGTTNRTRLSDYVQANADAVLKVHQSNYKIVGFTEETTIAELSTIGVPVIADIGSGLLDSACPWLSGPPPRWLAGEPAARQTLAAGADLVLFSGDKLFGGPQAGIIAGSAKLIAACSKHPLARALRPGSLVLGALQSTTLAYLYRDGEAIDFWRLATVPTADLIKRATEIVDQVLRHHTSPDDEAKRMTMSVVDTEGVPGGGTLPGVTLPSAGIRLGGDHTRPLRLRDHPIIARVDDGDTIIDLRTIDPVDDAELVAALTDLVKASTK